MENNVNTSDFQINRPSRESKQSAIAVERAQLNLLNSLVAPVSPGADLFGELKKFM